MKIAITGSNGFIGKCLVEKLKTTEHEVLELDIHNWDIQNIPRDGSGIEQHWLFYDCVVHLAGLVKVGESVCKPSEYYNTNIMGTKRVIDAFPDAKFIFASTGAATNPTSPYAKSKLLAEDIVKAECKEYTIFRFYNVGGRNPSNSEGLHAATVNACGTGLFTIYGNDYNTRDGTCIRDYVHVDDLCDAIVRAIHEPGAMTDYEPLGSGHSYTVLEYVTAFLEENGPKFKVEYGPRRRGDNESSQVSRMSKFMKPKKTIKDIVKI